MSISSSDALEWFVMAMPFWTRPKTAGNSEKQRKTASGFAIILAGDWSETQDFRREREAARCNFWEEQRKQRTFGGKRSSEQIAEVMLETRTRPADTLQLSREISLQICC
jgi:hypothetical protein